MGRIVDLCAEVAAAADEGPEGLVLPPEDWDRLRESWGDEDIEDALKIVRENLLEEELVDAADAVSFQLVELLGRFGEAAAFEAASAGQATVGFEALGHLVRRVTRLEEVLAGFREGKPPDRRGFDALRGRLADYGIESSMQPGGPPVDEEE